MRVKVGDQWFEARPGQPVMVELTEQDKRNVAEMSPEDTRYACFDDRDTASIAEKAAWMDERRE